jgi:hypothetical protein
MNDEAEAETLSWACIACAGRGWVRPARSDSFPESCSVCGGYSRLGATQLAKILVGKGRALRVTTMRQYLRRVAHDRASSNESMHVLKAIKRRFPAVLQETAPA